MSMDLYYLLLILFIFLNIKFLIETRYMIQIQDHGRKNKRNPHNFRSIFQTNPFPPSRPNRHVINFYRDPDIFTNTIADCIKDDDCRIIYHHIQKTGGKTVEYRFFKAFPFIPENIEDINGWEGLFSRENDVGAKSCCWKQMFKRFKKYTRLYCPIKFMSYEATSNQLEEILHDCLEWNGRQSRYVILVSFRDPEARTLSQIHQMCNKNFESRRPKMQKACLTCQYTNETKEAFYFHTKLTNKAFRYVINTTYLNTLPRVDALTFQIDDIDSMFDRLKGATGIDFPTYTSNPEKRDVCDFGMTSEIFRGLAPSREIYRKLVGGL